MKWWQKTIAYEIYPRSFYDTQGKGTGTLQGIIEKLPYLQSLHIGALWITPVFRSPMIDNGYDVADYTDIDPMFGEMKDMDQLIQEGKKYDIRIVLDLVFNHTSDQCPWFLESKKDRTNQYSDWYIWKDPKPDGSAPTNWRSIFGGSAWTYCKERNQYYLHTFAVQQPDLNWADAQVRKALADVANFWLDKGAGGFRMDAVTYIKKPEVFADGPVDANDGMSAIHPLTANQPGILDYLHEFKDRTVKGKDVFTVGEANGVETDELPQWVGKDGVFDMIFSFDHVHVPLGKAEEWCYAPEWKLSELKQALNNIEKSTGEGWCPVFFENHDSPRSVNNFFTCEGSYADKAEALKIRLLNEMDAMDADIAKKKAEEEQKKNAGEAGKPVDIVVKVPVKKTKNVTIKNVTHTSSWRIESEADIDKCVNQLKQSLMTELGKDDVDVVNVEF